MPATLKNLRVDFASLVDEPANPGAKVVLFKRETPQEGRARVLAQVEAAAAELEKFGNEQVEEFAKVGRKMSGPRMSALKAAVDQLAMILNEVSGPADMAEAADDKESEMPKEEKKVEKAEAQPEPTPTPEATPTAEVTKADAPSEDIAKRMEALEKRAADAEKKAAEAIEKAAAETDKRETAEAIAKVRETYTALPMKAEEFGPVWKRVSAALAKEDVAEVERLLKAGDEAMRLALTERGQRGELNADSPTEQINKRAQQMVADKTAAHYADAITKLQADPANRSLFEAYRLEQLATH